jgi:hypothetical protein
LVLDNWLVAAPSVKLDLARSGMMQSIHWIGGCYRIAVSRSALNSRDTNLICCQARLGLAEPDRPID